MESKTPFCERNTKAWVGLLVVLGVLVLIYAIWVANDRGGLNGFTNAATHGGRGAHPATTVPSSANQRQGQNSASQGSATGVTTTMGGATGSAASPSVEVVTGATPNGGFKLVGGTSAMSLQEAFNNAADVIRPCVVKISVGASNSNPQVLTRPNGPQFLEPLDGVPDLVIAQQPYESVGSGLIIDPEGYVVTNQHVVANASSVVVSRFNKQQEHLIASVVAVDPSCDLALLRIEEGGRYPAATLADSDRSEVGNWVLAVGNPFGLEHTVTAGIIGAKGTTLDIGGVRYTELLQTDAPINRGSSGGPLVDLTGKAVGINTAIYAPTGVFNGTGFAIPSNTVQDFLTRALGRRSRSATTAQTQTVASGPALGIGVLDVDADIAARLAYEGAGGAFVSSVVDGSPASEAEIRREDVIMAIGGLMVTNGAAVQAVWTDMVSGQTAEIVVWRRGKNKILRVVK